MFVRSLGSSRTLCDPVNGFASVVNGNVPAAMLAWQPRARPPQTEDLVWYQLAAHARLSQESAVHSHFDPNRPPEPERAWQPGWLPDPGRTCAPRDLNVCELHMWLLPQAPSDIALQRAARVLNARESQRAAAFASATDRRRYVAAHAFMRGVLAHYTGMDERALCFTEGPSGKPALVPTHADRAVHFNLSHSGELALCGVAREQRLGVDVEVVRSLDDLQALLRSSFSTDERRQFDALEPALRHEAFFAAWTRKEAVIKALGTGLSTEPARIEVSIDPRQPAAVVAIDHSAAAARNWSLWGARLSQGAWWAAACECTRMALRLWCLQPDRGSAHTPE
jgi:4'-phosphopantetheinyl transferase